MAKNRYAPKQLDELAQSMSGRMQNLATHAKTIQLLQQQLSEFLPHNLAAHCKVLDYHHGVLSIETSSAAYATRLNYTRSALISLFRESGLRELSSLSVKASPKLSRQQPSDAINESKPKRKILSNKAAEAILSVAEQAQGSLKEKLERLAALADREK